MPLIYKDGVPENMHPLNVVEVPDDFIAAIDPVTRPPLYEVYMRMAEELAKRSTCARLQVGTVLTNATLEHVVSIGYNGNARGFPNRCDSTDEGLCGCIHSEMNALVKAPGELRDKVAFVTASPCVMCAKQYSTSPPCRILSFISSSAA
jgi:deoxycytidylate deaminase